MISEHRTQNTENRLETVMSASVFLRLGSGLWALGSFV